MRYALLILVMLWVMLWPAAALASDPLLPANKAYAAGNFHLARTLYRQHDSTDAHMKACRTGLVIGGFHEAGDKAVATLHQAIKDCATAITRDPSHLNARISYAIGLGLEGKRLKKLRYAKASRRLLEELLVGWPNNATLHAAIGGWHSEVHSAGFLARLFLGARRDIAEEHLQKAIALAPTDMGVRFEYLKFLARGKKDGRALALEECDRLLALMPQDSFEYFLQEKTQAIQKALITGKKKPLKKALEAASPFANINEWRDLPPYPFDGVPEDDEATSAR